jgi:feruloyl esterase
MVKLFRKGDRLPNAFVGPPGVEPATLNADLCLVKLVVGPGNVGAPNAPSTSIGIGIEVWLPSKSAWNGRIHAVGGGGWTGGEETDVSKISSGTIGNDMRPAPIIAVEEGAVSSSSDGGHASFAKSIDASFAFNPDGTLNTPLLSDFASRSIHEQIVATKALARAYYGVAPRFSYWDGGSNGGRQALMLAQRYPTDVDGIISGLPAINWMKFVTSDLYPQIVIQRDLGGKYMTAVQLDLVSNAAIAACDVVGERHLGFILDPRTCHYDPTKDKGVICAAVGGSNVTSDCVTPHQALAINKIWYGMTSDGSVPDPAKDNGVSPLTGKRKWFGLPRGTNLRLLASDPAFPLAADTVAIALQNPRLGSPLLRNALANGQQGWKSLTYAQLAQAFDAGVSLQPKLGFLDSNSPDLSAFKKHGGKLIQTHGTADGLITYLGSIAYYDAVKLRMGPKQVRDFYKLYIIPGMAHGPDNGTSNQDANPPYPQRGQGEIFGLLTRWVEKGVAPATITMRSVSEKPVAKSLPMCAYPAKINYVKGDVYLAASYMCR